MGEGRGDRSDAPFEAPNPPPSCRPFDSCYTERLKVARAVLQAYPTRSRVARESLNQPIPSPSS